MLISSQSSIFNESTTNLGISGVYTWPARASCGSVTGSQNTSLYNNFNVQVITDQASLANGLVIQGSQDSAFTTPRVVTQSSVVATTPLTVTTPVTYPFYRVVLTNGAVAQTSLSLVSSFTL